MNYLITGHLMLRENNFLSNLKTLSGTLKLTRLKAMPVLYSSVNPKHNEAVLQF